MQLLTSLLALGQVLWGQQGPQGPRPMWQADQRQAGAKASLDCHIPLGFVIPLSEVRSDRLHQSLRSGGQRTDGQEPQG